MTQLTNDPVTITGHLADRLCRTIIEHMFENMPG
jgi:hypothetical protein